MVPGESLCPESSERLCRRGDRGCLRPIVPTYRIQHLGFAHENGRLIGDPHLPCLAQLNIATGVGYLPGGHLPPPKFGHLPTPNSDIYHPQKTYICQEDNCHPHFFFWRTFLGFLDLQLMEDIKDGKEWCLTRWSWST